MGCGLLALAGCSFAGAPSTQDLTIDTPGVANANCTIADSKGGVTAVLTPPETIVINRLDGPYSVECASEGYEVASLRVFGTRAGGTGNMPVFPPDLPIEMRRASTPVVAARAPSNDAVKPVAPTGTQMAALPPAPMPAPEPVAPFSVQVGAFRTEELASRLRDQLMEKGYEPTLQRGGNWVRVRIGGYEDIAAARAAAREFARKERMDALAVRNGR